MSPLFCVVWTTGLCKVLLDLVLLCRLFYAYFIPYFYIQVYANVRGVDPRIANYVLAIMNAMTVPSRILPGFLADRYGR